MGREKWGGRKCSNGGSTRPDGASDENNRGDRGRLRRWWVLLWFFLRQLDWTYVGFDFVAGVVVWVSYAFFLGDTSLVLLKSSLLNQDENYRVKSNQCSVEVIRFRFLLSHFLRYKTKCRTIATLLWGQRVKIEKIEACGYISYLSIGIHCRWEAHPPCNKSQVLRLFHQPVMVRSWVFSCPDLILLCLCWPNQVVYVSQCEAGGGRVKNCLWH